MKIDQSFIVNLGRDSTASAIATSVTNLAHLLDMTVTAEGVETAKQRDAVISIGCDLAQGYLYARPMPAAEISALLGRRAS